MLFRNAKVIHTLIDSINIPLIILHWARNSEAASDAKKVCTPKSVYVEPSWIICSWCLHWLLYDGRYAICYSHRRCYMMGLMMGGMLCTLAQEDLMVSYGTVSMLLTTVLLMYIYTACWLNNYVVQLCPFWCNSYGARLSRLLTGTLYWHQVLFN